ncbi:hypothetical protein DSL92_03475 [Billgrantia gudaonensis]|uniref:Uncharacterized protein n=1 Tax=Billgrantia gudaonensis TaxID=376427 RepID=A0A3S0VT01_9GAMM|nr:hypothetical protein DSL92_03475 [Halomonas gudaonensis]
MLAGAGLGLGSRVTVSRTGYMGGAVSHDAGSLALGLYGAGMVGGRVELPVAALDQPGLRLANGPMLYLLPVLRSRFCCGCSPTMPIAPALLMRRRRNVHGRRAPLLAGCASSLAPWRLAVVYSFFYGAFVALSLWLPAYLVAQYDLVLREAALMACVPLAVGVGQVVGNLGRLAGFSWRLRWWVQRLRAGLPVPAFLSSFHPQIEGVERILSLRYTAPLWGFLRATDGRGAGHGAGTRQSDAHDLP